MTYLQSLDVVGVLLGKPVSELINLYDFLNAGV